MPREGVKHLSVSYDTNSNYFSIPRCLVVMMLEARLPLSLSAAVPPREASDPYCPIARYSRIGLCEFVTPLSTFLHAISAALSSAPVVLRPSPLRPSVQSRPAHGHWFFPTHGQIYRRRSMPG